MSESSDLRAGRVEHYRSAELAASPGVERYRGLPIHAVPGLHAAAAGLLGGVLAPEARVLDLAAGTGAFSLRLADLGYRVTAADLVEERFQPRDTIPFRGIDLESDFGAGFEQRFDAVAALEIVEHLENPRHFLRQCRELLEPGGRLLVSTPNVESPVSLLMMLRTGSFHWFAERDYRNLGHISPISRNELERAAAEARLRPERVITTGNPFRHLKGARRMALAARVLGAMTARPEMRGEMLLALFRAE